MRSSPQRIICFVVVLLTLTYWMPVRAQFSVGQTGGKSFTGLHLPGERLKKEGSVFLVLQPGYIPPSGPSLPEENRPSAVEKIIPADYYYCQSGFFCKREWDLEKATHIPFRFRLGSLDYCNALEGKR